MVKTAEAMIIPNQTVKTKRVIVISLHVNNKLLLLCFILIDDFKSIKIKINGINSVTYTNNESKQQIIDKM